MATDPLVKSMTFLDHEDKYFDWSTDMEGVLMTIGADTIVDGTEAKPEVPVLDWKADTKEVNLVSLYQFQSKRADEWELRNRKAKGYILQTIDKGLKIEVKGLKTAKEMWDKLASMHKLDRPKLRQATMQDVLNLRLKPSDDTRKHVEGFTELLERAIAAGETIDDKRKCDLFLNTLPITYQHVETVFQSRSKSEQTWVNLKVLFAEHANKLHRELDVEVIEAFYSHAQKRSGKGRGTQPTRGGKSLGKGKEQKQFGGDCWFCEKPGHRKADCTFYKKSQERGKGKNDDNQKNLSAAFASAFTFGGAAIIDNNARMLFHAGRNDRSVTWLLDLGASGHITGDKSILSNIRQLATPTVFQTPGGYTEAREVGQVLCQGSALGGVSFENVYYVPGSANLLSYGILLEKGWEGVPTKRGGYINVGGKEGPVWELEKAGLGGYLRTVTFDLVHDRKHVKTAYAIDQGTENTSTNQERGKENKSTTKENQKKTQNKQTNDSKSATEQDERKTPTDTLQNWHRRIGHKGISGIKTLAKKGLIKISDIDDTNFTT